MPLLYELTAKLIRGIYDRRIEAPPVLDPAIYFPHAADFVAAWEGLRGEARSVAAQLSSVPRFHDIMPEQTAISANDGRDWRMFIVKAYGIEVPRNAATCPTLAALAALPDVLSASFSFLGQRKHIPAHRGPFRGVLRFYLVLDMPTGQDGTPSAVLRIADTRYRLADGDFLLWDDTFEHEVWNESDDVRTVLLLDVKRRDMPLDMDLLSRGLISVVRLGMRLRGFG